MKHKDFIDKVGYEKVQEILEVAPKDAKYYVDEYNQFFGVHGYYTDKCVIGLHNVHKHYLLYILRTYLEIHLRKQHDKIHCL